MITKVNCNWLLKRIYVFEIFWCKIFIDNHLVLYAYVFRTLKTPEWLSYLEFLVKFYSPGLQNAHAHD